MNQSANTADSVICEFYDCSEIASVEIEVRGEIVYVCSHHEDEVGDRTGYCGAGCQLGYGCDQSC